MTYWTTGDLDGPRSPSSIESVDYSFSILIERLHVRGENLSVVVVAKQLCNCQP